MSSYYLKRNEKLYGPFSEEKVKNLTNNGTFGEEDQITMDRISWQTVADFRVSMNMPYDLNYPQGETSIQGGYDPNCQQGGYDPNCQQGGYDPNYQQGGYDPNYQQGGYDPNYQQGGYDPNCQQGLGPVGKPSMFWCLYKQPRLARKDFWLFILIYTLIAVVVDFGLLFVLALISTTLMNFGVVILYIVNGIITAPFYIHRLHDADKSIVSLVVMWISWLVSPISALIVPLYGLIFSVACLVSSIISTVLCIFPGTRGPNKYGNAPVRFF